MQIHSTILIFAIVLFFSASLTRAEGISPLGKHLAEFIDKKEIAGAVAVVAKRDGVVDITTVGKADIASAKPMRPDTIFWIASMTKPITGAAIMMLQDEGKLSFDDPVGKYVPELAEMKTKDGKAFRLTLKQLLTHTSGMPEATADESKAAETLADLIPAFAKKPLQFEPGSKWAYCQSGINTLGRIVEIVSGKSFQDFLHDRFFAPLGMKDTTFYLNEEQASRLATSYKRVNGNLDPASIFILDGKHPVSRNRYPAANGGLFSTGPDYTRFCQMILNNGSLDGKHYLKPESVKLMTSIQTGELKTGFTIGNGWGLGWCVVRQPQGVTAVLSPGTHGHGGAYGTQAWIDPVKGVIYVLMVQRADFPNSDASDVRKVFQEDAQAFLK